MIIIIIWYVYYFINIMLRLQNKNPEKKYFLIIMSVFWCIASRFRAMLLTFSLFSEISSRKLYLVITFDSLKKKHPVDFYNFEKSTVGCGKFRIILHFILNCFVFVIK